MRRFVALAMFSLLPVAAPAASALFGPDEVLEIRLSGPLGTIASQRKDSERQEHPFILRMGDEEVPVHVRVRGKSRKLHCDFPPLRLRLEPGDADGTVFAGQEKLKLVTHCRSGREHFENNLLDEYAAYRMFNLVSETSYRVRLLRVTYEDTDNELRKLDQPYYAMLLESDASLANRTGASVLKVPGVVYSRLDPGQTARMSVFHYLIANTDWSLVAAQDEKSCCHNVDLLERGQSVLPVPYDFDRSGLVNASYAKPAEGARIRKVTMRLYRGYCRAPIDDIAAALDAIVAQRAPIVELVGALPVVGKESAKERVQFIDGFFKEAVDDREKLLERFEKDCIGRR